MSLDPKGTWLIVVALEILNELMNKHTQAGTVTQQ